MKGPLRSLSLSLSRHAPTRLTAALGHHLQVLALSAEIFGKESTLPFVSTPLARANAEEHLRQLRNTLKTLERIQP